MSCAGPSARCKRSLTLDFRDQPTRAELGFGSGASSSSLTCDAVSTTVLLPTGSIVLASGGYAASALNPAGAPDTVYLNSPPLPVEEAARLGSRLAVSLRLVPLGEIESWRARMQAVAAKDVQDMRSSYLAGRNGAAGISMQLRGSVDAGDAATRTAEVQLTFLWTGSARSALRRPRDRPRGRGPETPAEENRPSTVCIDFPRSEAETTIEA